MVLDIVESRQEDVELPAYANTLIGKLKKY